MQSLAFSPDGTRLASGSFREVKIWRLETADRLRAAAKASLQHLRASDLLKKIAAAAR